MKWYVIRVVSGKEKKTKETIENYLKEVNNEKVVSKLLVPSQKAIQIRSGKKINVEKNSFPGYIFVECESIDDVEANIKRVNGVAQILKQPLTPSEIERLLGGKVENTNEDNLRINEKVKIIDGPFNTFIGTVRELDISKQKAKLSVLIFGRDTLLDLNFSQFMRED